MIKLSCVTKNFGETTALDKVSFEVKKGQVVGFLGPNGAGKTTTMRVITGFMPPTSGTVKINNINLANDSLAVRKLIGYLPENNPLYQEMKAGEYLTFLGQIRQAKNLKDRLNQTAQACGISQVWNQKIEELSRGFKQRVGLAQCLIHDPEILIMDEPTSGLDPNQAAEIRQLIKKIGKQKTVILSTHILSEVKQTCNQAVVINKGKIVASGKLSDLEKQKEGGKLIVRFEGGKSVVDKLSNLEGVAEVTELEAQAKEKLVEIEIVGRKDIRASVSKLVSAQGGLVLELTEEKESLEDVFRRLTT